MDATVGRCCQGVDGAAPDTAALQPAERRQHNIDLRLLAAEPLQSDHSCVCKPHLAYELYEIRYDMTKQALNATCS